jgi:hypothetical protein
MRKIAVIGLMLLTVAVVGCGKKAQEGAEDQAAPAPAAQEAAPAPAPAPQQPDAMQNHDQAAPATPAAPAAPEPGNDQGMSHNGGNAQ